MPGDESVRLRYSGHGLLGLGGLEHGLQLLDREADGRCRRGRRNGPVVEVEVHVEAVLHQIGRFVEHDAHEAARLYKMAEMKGDCQSMINLGYLYGYGHLGEPDYEASFKQFVKVMALGNYPEAIYKVGDAYARAQVVERDLRTAYKLYRKCYDNCGDLVSIKAQAAFRLAELIIDPKKQGVGHPVRPGDGAALLPSRGGGHPYPARGRRAMETLGRAAGEAGWHASRYNLMATVPGSDNVAIANLFKGTCAEYNLIEVYLLSMVEELNERHPVIERFAKRGLICNFDERAALETFARTACAHAHRVELTICPTMGCNFDCPYCFESHRRGKMAQNVQDDVVALAERMVDACGANDLAVTWFDGEPLLALDVIESLSERLMSLTDERGGTYTASIITNGYLLAQGTVNLLARCKVASAQVTVDGLGATHDATRRLTGGGPTFNRIVANLRDCEIPLRHHPIRCRKSSNQPTW